MLLMSTTLSKNMLMGLVLTLLMTFGMSLMQPFYVNAQNPPADPDANSSSLDTKDSFQMVDGKLVIKGDMDHSDGSDGAWSDFYERYRGFIVGISGVGAITMIVLFIVQFMKLGASAGNPQARSQALGGVLWTGIAAAGLGAVTIITGFFYNSVG